MNPQTMSKIKEMTVERLSEILDFLQLEYTDYGSYYAMSCPIHGSDNKESMSIYKNTGIWSCWTNSCHEDCGRGIFDFVKAFLDSMGDHRNMSQIAYFCAAILNADFSKDEPIKDYELKIGSSSIVSNLFKKRKLLQGKILRKNVREKLKIPSEYYLGRGYCPEILDKYDVGLCNTYGKEMFGRIVVPVYDDDYNYMIGCVGRSQNQQCPKCKKYHSSKHHCPTNNLEEIWASKWKNSKGFTSENYLYNYWFAKENIKKSKTVILVEGQGDIWRLEESGIHCAVGVFGAKLTDSQKIMLEQSGAQNLIIASDNDVAGDKFRERVKEKCGRLFNIVDILMEKKDFGDMTVDETKRMTIPILERFS